MQTVFNKIHLSGSLPTKRGILNQDEMDNVKLCLMKVLNLL